jgi:hypothetical protein
MSLSRKRWWMPTASRASDRLLYHAGERPSTSFRDGDLGKTVIVEGIDITEDDQLVAVCRKDKTKQRISLSELPLPLALPKGAEWISAYRYWRTGKIR